MAKKNKSTNYLPREWAKHLRPCGKKQVAKGERRFGRRLTKDTLGRNENLSGPGTW